MNLDTAEFRTWSHDEWKEMVLQNPGQARDFVRARLEPLRLEGHDVVSLAYALGLADYLLGQHLTSNGWYKFALEQPDLKARKGPIWSDEKAALRKESMFWNNIGINCEILGDYASAEDAYARSRAIDLRVGDLDAAWMTAINLGMLRFRELQFEAAQNILGEAAAYFESRGDLGNQGKALLNLAAAEQSIPPGTLAVDHAKQAVQIFKQLSDSTEAMRALVSWGQLLFSQGKLEALDEVFPQMDVMRPRHLPALVRIAELVLRSRQAAWKENWDDFQVLVNEIEQLEQQHPDLPRSDSELEVLMTAAYAKGGLPMLFAVFREHNQNLREQFGQRSSAMLAEVWELNDREEQLHQMEQLEIRLLFAQRMIFAGALALLFALFSVGLYMWKRKSDSRFQRVVVRLLRQRHRERSRPSPPPTAQDSSWGSIISKQDSGVENDSPLSPFLTELFEGVERLVQEEKVYRKPNFMLGELGSLMHTNTKYITQAIRQIAGMSFPEYINMLRVQDAQEVMLAKENQGLSLDQIADLVGFGTRRTFYRQFTKYTGMPPGQFLKLSQAEKNAFVQRD